jgi:hypothetical protein
MRVYKVSYHHPDMGCQLAWAASQRQAQKILRQAVDECDDPRPSSSTT